MYATSRCSREDQTCMLGTLLLDISWQEISQWTPRCLHRSCPLNEVLRALVLLPTSCLDPCHGNGVLNYRINDIKGYPIFGTTTPSIKELIHH